MFKSSKLNLFTTILFLLFFIPAVVVVAGDQIHVSGFVKKEISNKNKVEGAYVVTDAGLYIAVKLEKKQTYLFE